MDNSFEKKVRVAAKTKTAEPILCSSKKEVKIVLKQVLEAYDNKEINLVCRDMEVFGFDETMFHSITNIVCEKRKPFNILLGKRFISGKSPKIERLMYNLSREWPNLKIYRSSIDSDDIDVNFLFSPREFIVAELLGQYVASFNYQASSTGSLLSNMVEMFSLLTPLLDEIEYKR